MSANGACEGCTCGRADGSVVAPPAEGFERSRQEARTFTAAENKYEGVEPAVPLRSKKWFNNVEDPEMTSLYTERYLNSGLTLSELRPLNKPMIGIAQTGSDLSPCNRHHLELAKRVRDGIIANGGTPFEFPCHPIQETGKRPTASLDRNLSYLSLVEVLYGYPLDGVVLLTGCDKTTPALLMAAATVNIPAIVMNVGPMLNGYNGPALVGSGGVVWDSRKLLAEGKINEAQFINRVALSAPSVGHCNTMGTASTMNALAEALGMALPGSSSIPAAYRERGACGYSTGLRIVDLVREDIKPSDILTREAFENAIAVNTAIGGSTNAPIHLNAIAKHIGVKLDCSDWMNVGYELPLLVNVMPAGEWLCEEYHRAGGLPAVIAELLAHDALPHPSALTVSGQTMSENCLGDFTTDRRVIRPFDTPLVSKAGFLNLSGSLFDSAIMKTSVISAAFREQYLSDPEDPEAFEGPVAVFDGPEDYHHRIEHAEHVQAGTILIMRGAGPLGYPGAAEVVNMIPPGHLIKKGIELPCIGDGRQSGTSGSPSILNASPEAAAGGMLAYIRDGDRIRIDLKKRTADVLMSAEEIEQRKTELGTYEQRGLVPDSQTPWQEIFRNEVGQLSEGMVLNRAVKFQRIAQTKGIPRANH
ncbi:dihydroxy-acid dehydratase [Kwoniella newhampshirensis]|uniref:Dihydroxy-acid dehydratase n=1 Tax=Kwoniella newhampshirensis TaxID=1651941 RepID=A0AAW0YZ32_9TREE